MMKNCVWSWKLCMVGRRAKTTHKKWFLFPPPRKENFSILSSVWDVKFIIFYNQKELRRGRRRFSFDVAALTHWIWAFCVSECLRSLKFSSLFSICLTQLNETFAHMETTLHLYQQNSKLAHSSRVELEVSKLYSHHCHNININLNIFHPRCSIISYLHEIQSSFEHKHNKENSRTPKTHKFIGERSRKCFICWKRRRSSRTLCLRCLWNID